MNYVVLLALIIPTVAIHVMIKVKERKEKKINERRRRATARWLAETNNLSIEQVKKQLEFMGRVYEHEIEKKRRETKDTSNKIA